MPSDYDATEFVDNDFRPTTKTAYGSASAQTAPPGASASPLSPMNNPGNRAPSREEVDSRVGEAQQKLAELKRVQEELERERASLEETRRRQSEFQTGREETLQSLTRAIGLLTESEFSARRDAEQMSKSLIDLQEALAKVQATSEQGWTRDNFSTELTRALTVIENARMEYNTARLKFPVLSGETTGGEKTGRSAGKVAAGVSFGELSLGQLCKYGLALTWPLALVALIVGMMLVLVIKR